jgi:hypothetical protein
VARRGLGTLRRARITPPGPKSWPSVSPSPWPWPLGDLPVGTAVTRDGKAVYFPDIGEADAQIIAHWIDRATRLTHPVLIARYADLVWDRALRRPRLGSRASNHAIPAAVLRRNRSGSTHFRLLPFQDRRDRELALVHRLGVLHDHLARLPGDGCPAARNMDPRSASKNDPSIA